MPMKNKRFFSTAVIVVFIIVFLTALSACYNTQEITLRDDGESVDYGGGRADGNIVSGDGGESLSGGYAETNEFGLIVHGDTVSIKKITDYRREYVTIPSVIELGDKTYTVTGIEKHAFQNTLVKEIVISEGVREISGYAFDGNIYLEKISLPNSIEKIGSYAFYNCGALKEVDISGVAEFGLPLIVDCDSIETLGLPFLKTDLKHVFDEYGNSIPSTLKKVTVRGGAIPSEAFKNVQIEEVVLEEGVESIGDEAFYSCDLLAKVSFAKGIKKIGKKAFYDCPKLTEVVLNEGLESLDDAAFSDCDKLTDIILPEGLKRIGNGAFDNCPALKTLVLPDSLEEINKFISKGTSLEKLTIPYIGISRENSTVLSNIVSSSYASSLKELTVTDADGIADSALFRSSIEKVSLNDGITSIGYMAFAYCENLYEVNVPDSVSAIGDMAFYGCYGLDSLYIPSGTENLGSRILGENNNCVVMTPLAQAPESWATNWYSNPDTVIWDCLNNDMTVDGYRVAKDDEFVYLVKDGKAAVLKARGISKNQYKTIPSSVSSNNVEYVVDRIYDYAFYKGNIKAVQMLDTLKEIGAYAFAYCSDLQMVAMSSVSQIGMGAFRNCRSIKEIYLPESLQVIATYAFYECESLQKIRIPQSVKDIGGYAFAYCSGLEEVVFGEGLEKIGLFAFTQCISLKNIDLPSTVTTVEYGCFKGCSSLTKADLSENLSEISTYVFADCVSLSDVNVYEGVTRIWSKAFSGCSSLVSLKLPDSLDNIQNGAFENCEGLTEIIIPAKVTRIYADVFNGCTNLSSIVFENTESWKGYDGKALFVADMDFSDAKANIGYFATNSGAQEIVYYQRG